MTKPKGFKAKEFDGWIDIAERSYKDYWVMLSFELKKDMTFCWQVYTCETWIDSIALKEENTFKFKKYEDAVEFYNNWKPVK